MPFVYTASLLWPLVCAAMVYVGIVGDGKVGVAQFTEAWPAGAATLAKQFKLYRGLLYIYILVGGKEGGEKEQRTVLR